MIVVFFQGASAYHWIYDLEENVLFILTQLPLLFEYLKFVYPDAIKLWDDKCTIL